MRARALLLLLLTAACSRAADRDLGPPPAADHQATIRERTEERLAANHELAAPSAYRFAAPSAGRVARWHFEPQVEGQPHEIAYVHGWCVAYWVTPEYTGYPPQPESPRMAFFADGELRGIFSAGVRRAPLELDHWHALWVDSDWLAAANHSRPPR